MKQLHAVVVLASVAVLAACSDSPTAFLPENSSMSPRFLAGGNAGPAATGAGHFYVTGDLRTFSFTGRTHMDGSVRGQAELNNRDQDVRDHISVDCLNIVGNIAYMSGVITRSSIPARVGLNRVWSVQDNGEGANAPADMISLVFLASAASACNTTLPVPTIAVFGNIQVRP